MIWCKVLVGKNNFFLLYILMNLLGWICGVDIKINILLGSLITFTLQLVVQFNNVCRLKNLLSFLFFIIVFSFFSYSFSTTDAVCLCDILSFNIYIYPFFSFFFSSSCFFFTEENRRRRATQFCSPALNHRKAVTVLNLSPAIPSTVSLSIGMVRQKGECQTW